MFKKVISILLISILLHDNICFLILFKVIQLKIKSEIKHAIETIVPISELTLVEIDSYNIEDIDWLEDGKEFRMNGNFYDIVKSEQSGNKFKYYCINDKKETELFKNLDLMIMKQILNYFNSSDILQKIINKDFVQYFNQLFYLPKIRIKLIHNLISSVIYQLFLSEIPSPPPRIF